MMVNACAVCWGGVGLGLFSTYSGVVWLDWGSSVSEVSESSGVMGLACKVSLAGVSVVLVALRYAMLRNSYRLPSGFVGSGPPSISAMASSPYFPFAKHIVCPSCCSTYVCGSGHV